MFQATIYHTEKDEDKKINGEEEIRTKPDKSKTKNIKFAKDDKINKDGFIDENTLIEDPKINLRRLFQLNRIKMIIQRLLNMKINLKFTEHMKNVTLIVII